MNLINGKFYRQQAHRVEKDFMNKIKPSIIDFTLNNVVRYSYIYPFFNHLLLRIPLATSIKIHFFFVMEVQLKHKSE